MKIEGGVYKEWIVREGRGNSCHMVSFMWDLTLKIDTKANVGLFVGSGSRESNGEVNITNLHGYTCLLI